MLLAASLFLQSIVLYQHISAFEEKVHAVLSEVEFELYE